jgi:hypothetical protein
MDAWVSVMTAVIGAVAGGAVTYFSSRSQLRIEAEHSYDRALRDLRLEHYQALFHLTRNIPREWITVELPTRSDVVRLREQFHDWYFDETAGGMFLSQEAREAYFALQNDLESIQARLTVGSEPVSDRDSVGLRQRASALRHQLATDLGTAERPRRSWTAPRSVASPLSSRQA